jgi:GTPase-associated system helical domain
MTVLDERFAHWVQDVELESGSERFTALRQAAESLAGGLTLAAAFDLVGYAVGRNSASAFEAVRAAVSQSDPTFAAAAVDLEPRLVATAALARILEDDDDTAAFVAEAVLSAEFAGLDSPVPELPALARAMLSERFRDLRNRVEVPSASLETIFDDPGLAGGRDPLPAERLDLLLDATRTLAEQLTSMLGTLGRRFETRLDAADEELEVLWWAFAQHSTQNGNQWRDLDAAKVLLRSGLELADRHRFNAEIPTAREILGRVLGPLAADEYSLAEVVSGAAEQVAVDTVTPGPLLPILTSCAEYLAFKGADEVAFQAEQAWVTSAGRYGVDPTIIRRGDEIATQVLREHLLARALR